MIWTVVFELITVVLRYGFGGDATRDTADTIGRLTLGIRVHHGYVGVVLVILAVIFCRQQPRRFRVLMILGLSLVCSDLAHHFLVLWPIEGDPHFDLVYPDR